MSAQLDFKSLAADLLSDAKNILPRWLPGGKQRGKEFVCGSLSGDAGGSLSINTNTGVWQDFATGEKGADLIDLYAAIHGMELGAAYRELSGQPAQRPRLIGITPPPAPERVVITPVPNGNPGHDCKHSRYGEPSRVWTYADANGDLLGYVARYDPPGEKKQIVPWTLTPSGWSAGQWPEPRPLYGLQQLAERPDAPALIVEGEKSTDAAREFAGRVYVVVTWPGGSQAFHKVGWSVLAGRDVLIWPDADDAGRRCAVDIATLIAESVKSVKLLDVSDLSGGWDAADSGFTWETFKQWAVPRASVYVPPSAPSGPADEETGEIITTTAPLPRHAAIQAFGLEMNSKGEPYVTVSNITRVLRCDPLLHRAIWFDEFLGRVMTIWGSAEPREWSDVDDINLQIYLQDSLGMPRLGKQTVSDAVQSVAYTDRRNEARAYIEGLTWDGIERLPAFLPSVFGTADDEYNQSAGRNFWVSMVARVLRPGCKVDTMLVLEGLQGAGKSKALSIIGGQWFAEAHQSPTDKDFYLNLSGKMLIEIGEMDAFSRAEVNKVKQVITCQTDRFRAPYERRAADHPRRCVFAGTTNRDDWNKDETGARRFWPVACASVNHDVLIRDRDQFFAEAAARLARGEGWWDMPAEATAAEQEARRDADALEESLSYWLIGKSEVTIGTIMTEFLMIPLERQDKGIQGRIAKALRSQGWFRLGHKVTRAGREVRVWRRKD